MRTPPDLLDRFIGEIDVALRTLSESPRATVPRPPPGAGADDAALSGSERELAARLMRVNHAGEISAQALYRGQAMVARDPILRADLLRAADEEHDHLRWCADRTQALGQNVSVLAPIWYLGSLAIGAAAGLAGDRVSLGFLAETERQVCEHLDGHLSRLPAADATSRAIVTEMRADELAHQRHAEDRGGLELPLPVRLGMRAAARVMTSVAHYL
jgi:ubiquinone biosynthesis monooxygenase Coq7